MTETITMKQAAIDLASQGFPVLPLTGKVPIGKLVPNGSKDATTELAKVTEWWSRKVGVDANVGIATGREMEGGGYLVVIDVDGDEGLATFNALQDEHGKLPVTRTAKTGGGGWHYYLRSAEPIKNSQARKAGWSKVDIRGVGGYVVAPPSAHESGELYAWAWVSPDIADLPPPWADAMTTTTLRATTLTTSSTPGEQQRVPVGLRHQTMVADIGADHRRGKSDEAIFAGIRADIDARYDDGHLVPDENIWKAIRARDSWPVEPGTVAEVTTIAEAADHLRNLDALLKSDPGAAMSEVTINAFITAQESDPVEAERARATLRRHRVSLKTHDAMVKKRRQFLREQAGLSAIPDFDGAPITYEHMPEGWGIKTGGVYYNGEDGPEQVIPVPLYLTRRVKTVGDEEERVEIQWNRDDEWHSILEKRSIVFGARSITGLADRGLPVNSENASRVVKFLAGVEAANRDAIPLEECCTQAGWIGTARFYPGAEGAVDFEPPFESDVSDKSFLTNGDYDEWKDVMLPLLDKYPLMRLHMAASFAAPLLKLTGHRNFVVHLWGPSGGGKSAALTAAMSVWGSPQQLVSNFHATVVGIEQRMALMNGLPVALNERQVANKGIDKLIYMAGESKGKTRGAKEGGLRKTASWQMILLTNGEEPLVSEFSREGERTRVIEHVGRVIDDEADSGVIYDLCDGTYGWAGRDYVAKMMAAVASTDWKAEHGKWKEVLAHDDRVVTHTSSMALLAMADCISRQWIFGVAVDDAWKQSLVWAKGLIEQGHSRSTANEAERAYDFIVGSIERYLGRFERPASMSGTIQPDGVERWGYIEDGKAHFNVTAFNELVRDADLSPLSVKRGLSHLNKLETEPDGHGNTNYFRRVRRGKYIVILLPHDVWAAIRGTNTDPVESEPTQPTQLSVDSEGNRQDKNGPEQGNGPY